MRHLIEEKSIKIYQKLKDYIFCWFSLSFMKDSDMIWFIKKYWVYLIFEKYNKKCNHLY